MRLENKIQILDTTLRDGSYVIDFQFTARDTEVLCRAFEQLGFNLIEVGHGVGINASPSKGKAAASDVDYIKAAIRGAPHSMIGMFCIPGIAELDHLRACAEVGLRFVRIGVNVDQVKLSHSFIQEAKRLGLFVCANFMKSYALPADKFSEAVRISADYGSDLIYLVDSAGGMLPQDIRQYIEAMRSVTDLPLGFHGHNNLNLAVANSLAAVEAGAILIDTTLLGMGRSSGNTPTEVMVPLLQRRFSALTELDPMMILDLADQVISPFLMNRRDDAEKTALGLAQVHSMYTERIRQTAKKNNRSFFSLITEVGRLDRLNLSEEVLAAAVERSLPNDNLRTLLGSVCLQEKIGNASTPEEIARAAIKLNLPIVISATSLEQGRQVIFDEGMLRVICSPQEALAILNHPDTAKKRLALDSAIRISHPEVYKQLAVYTEG